VILCIKNAQSVIQNTHLKKGFGKIILAANKSFNALIAKHGLSRIMALKR